MEEIVFTSGALLELFNQIQEFEGHTFEVADDGDSVVLSVDGSTYTLKSAVEDVPADEETIETIADIDDEVYSDIADSDYIGDDIDAGEPVESGIIKEAIKSLLLGGMIRLSSKLLK